MHKPSRAPFRLAIFLLLLLRLPQLWPRRKPETMRSILVLHHLLLGDTLMLTALLAKLRAQYPNAQIAMSVPRAYCALFAPAPYQVEVIPFDPRRLSTLWRLLRFPRPDWVLLPADNRYSWLARALGARWISAFAGDKPAHKNWLVDELRPYSPEPSSFSDTAATLCEGSAPALYQRAQWPTPPCAPFIRPNTPYCVLHLGASSSLKQWPAARWNALAKNLSVQGYQIVWSAGAQETALIDAADPTQRWINSAGKLDLAQLWHLLQEAALLVSPDTGVAHLGRAVGVPTLTLFGPGSALLCGAGEFWRAMPYRPLSVELFPCRNQSIQFFRTVDWVQRCERFSGTPPQGCRHAQCMEALSVEMVIDAANRALELPHG